MGLAWCNYKRKCTPGENAECGYGAANTKSKPPPARLVPAVAIFHWSGLPPRRPKSANPTWPKSDLLIWLQVAHLYLSSRAPPTLFHSHLHQLLQPPSISTPFVPSHDTSSIFQHSTSHTSINMTGRKYHQPSPPSRPSQVRGRRVEGQTTRPPRYSMLTTHQAARAERASARAEPSVTARF